MSSDRVCACWVFASADLAALWTPMAGSDGPHLFLTTFLPETVHSPSPIDPSTHAVHHGYGNYHIHLAITLRSWHKDHFYRSAGALSSATWWSANSFLFIIPPLCQTCIRNDIKQKKCRPHLPNCFGEVLQRADYFFITFSKGKVLDRRGKKREMRG